MDKLSFEFVLPSCLVLFSSLMLAFTPSTHSVCGFAISSSLWGLMMMSKPKAKIDEGLMSIIDNHQKRLEDLSKQLDSLKTAVNMKQLGR